MKRVGEVFDPSSLQRRCSTSLTSASRQTVFIRADWQEKFTYVIKTGFTPAQQEKICNVFFNMDSCCLLISPPCWNDKVHSDTRSLINHYIKKFSTYKEQDFKCGCSHTGEVKRRRLSTKILKHLLIYISWSLYDFIYILYHRSLFLLCSAQVLVSDLLPNRLIIGNCTDQQFYLRRLLTKWSDP